MAKSRKTEEKLAVLRDALRPLANAARIIPGYYEEDMPFCVILPVSTFRKAAKLLSVRLPKSCKPSNGSWRTLNGDAH